MVPCHVQLFFLAVPLDLENFFKLRWMLVADKLNQVVVKNFIFMRYTTGRYPFENSVLHRDNTFDSSFRTKVAGSCFLPRISSTKVIEADLALAFCEPDSRLEYR